MCIGGVCGCFLLTAALALDRRPHRPSRRTVLAVNLQLALHMRLMHACILSLAAQGGRAHLSKLFARHVRNTISKHRAVAQRGGDPDQLRDIQVGSGLTTDACAHALHATMQCLHPCMHACMHSEHLMHANTMRQLHDRMCLLRAMRQRATAATPCCTKPKAEVSHRHPLPPCLLPRRTCLSSSRTGGRWTSSRRAARTPPGRRCVRTGGAVTVLASMACYDVQLTFLWLRRPAL